MCTRVLFRYMAGLNLNQIDVYVLFVLWHLVFLLLANKKWENLWDLLLFHSPRTKKYEVKQSQETPPNNILATNAIVGKLNEVSKVAEALDIALRDTQNSLELGGDLSSNSNSLDRKTDGNVSIDGRESIDVSDNFNFNIIFLPLSLFFLSGGNLGVSIIPENPSRILRNY